DLGSDGHVDVVLLRQFIDAARRGDSLGDGVHAFQDFVERFATSEAFAHAAVATEGADAGGDQVAHACQPGEGERLGAECGPEAGDLDQSTREQVGVGVVAEVEPVADAGRESNDVFQCGGEFDADDVEIRVDTEAVGIEHRLYPAGESQVTA